MKNKNYPGDPEWIENLRKMHPFTLAIYVSIIGICIMFLFLFIGFNITKNNSNILISRWFTISTIILLLSSFVANQLKIQFKKDNLVKLLRFYYLSLFFGFSFGITQLFAWYSMLENGFSFGGENISYTYIYLLSGLHLLHFMGGIIYMVYLIFKALKAKKDVIVRLVFSTDPYELMLIDLLRIYWHFMGILWLILYFGFLLV
ncbi:MAG: hypothetical protein EAZ06_12255 [Cytophagales bacterium]|nr:MAG: hypothetical protein EAZ06_12255 [Cytophagales bacterium]